MGINSGFQVLNKLNAANVLVEYAGFPIPIVKYLYMMDGIREPTLC